MGEQYAAVGLVLKCPMEAVVTVDVDHRHVLGSHLGLTTTVATTVVIVGTTLETVPVAVVEGEKTTRIHLIYKYFVGMESFRDNY